MSLFNWGLITGACLLLLGTLFFIFHVNNLVLDMFIICAGLSLIFGAFGSTATMNFQGIVLTGAAAISMGLFYLILDEMDDRYFRVKIRGDVENSQIEMVGDRNYLGAYTENERTWDFVIFGKDIKQQSIYFYVTLPDNKELPSACIPKNKILPYLASGKVIEWTLQKTEEDDDFVLIDIEQHATIAKFDSCRQKNINTFSMFNFISNAFASDNDSTNQQNIQSLIEHLESDISYLRRDARSQLASNGIPIVKPLLKTLSNQPSYRTKLGAIVALTEMMRDNKPFRKDISQQIKNDDWKRLVDAAADEDRTIRIYASEFLYDLGDPKVISFALEKFPLSSENGRYNLILVIKGAVPDATQEEQTKTVKHLNEFKSDNTPKTNALIESVNSAIKPNP